MQSTATEHQDPPPRWTGSAEGFSLDNTTLQPVEREFADAELSRLGVTTDVAEALASRLVQVPGIGLCARLPYFRFVHGAGVPVSDWPTFIERLYPLSVAVGVLAGPENPLREFALRINETQEWGESERAATLKRDDHARAFQALTSSWERIGIASRIFVRAAAALPQGAAREACCALARAAIDEQLASSGGPPAFDEEINRLIRQLGADVAQRRAH